MVWIYDFQLSKAAQTIDNDCQFTTLAEGRRRENDVRSREIGMEVDDLQFRGEPHPSRLIYGPPLFRQLPTKLNPSGHTEYLRLATNPHLSPRDCLQGEIYGNFVLISQYFFGEKNTK